MGAQAALRPRRANSREVLGKHGFPSEPIEIEAARCEAALETEARRLARATTLSLAVLVRNVAHCCINARRFSSSAPHAPMLDSAILSQMADDHEREITGTGSGTPSSRGRDRIGTYTGRSR